MLQLSSILDKDNRRKFLKSKYSVGLDKKACDAGHNRRWSKLSQGSFVIMLVKSGTRD